MSPKPGRSLRRVKTQIFSKFYIAGGHIAQGPGLYKPGINLQRVKFGERVQSVNRSGEMTQKRVSIEIDARAREFVDRKRVPDEKVDQHIEEHVQQSHCR